MAEPSLGLLMQKLLDSQRETREDTHEIKGRLGRLESDMASHNMPSWSSNPSAWIALAIGWSAWSAA